MPPEGFRSVKKTSKYDIWGFACVLIEMLTGFLPWGELQFLEIIGSVLSDKKIPKIPTKEIPDQHRPVLTNTLTQCFQYEPVDSRYPFRSALRMHELWQDWDQLCRDEAGNTDALADKKCNLLREGRANPII